MPRWQHISYSVVQNSWKKYTSGGGGGFLASDFIVWIYQFFYRPHRFFNFFSWYKKNSIKVVAVTLLPRNIDLVKRFAMTDKGLDSMKLRNIVPPIKLFESKLRLQIRLDDFR